MYIASQHDANHSGCNLTPAAGRNRSPSSYSPAQKLHARPQWQLSFSISSLFPAGRVTTTRPSRFMQPAAVENIRQMCQNMRKYTKISPIFSQSFAPANLVSTAFWFSSTVAAWLALYTSCTFRSAWLTTDVLT